MNRPNLLLIMTDQQKATSLDLYNTRANFIRTPGLTALAEEGTVFEAAYCPYPLCVPSRISMLTGMYPSHHGHIGNVPCMADRYDTIFGAAKQNGYRTMLVGKDHAYTEARTGGDPGEHPAYMDRIFDRLYFALHNTWQPPEIMRDRPHIQPWLMKTKTLHRLWGSEAAPWTSDQTITARLHEVATEYLRDWHTQDRPAGTPFAMWLSFPDPHEFYQAAHDVVDLIDPDAIQLPPNWDSDIANRAEYMQFFHWYFNAGGVPEDEVLKQTRIYLAMCKTVDLYLEQLLALLKELGVWEETLVVFASDHGDFNGEHQLVQKFNCAYDGCCRVPLVIGWPGRTRGGRRYEHPVNLTDLASTVCELLGWDRFEQNQGRSLADVLTADVPQARECTVVESGVPGPSLTCRDIPNFEGHRYDRVPAGRGCWDPPHRYAGKVYAIRTTGAKLIVRQDQRSEFYDLAGDPWEMVNRIDDPALQGEILRHYELLAQHLAGIAFKQQGVHIADQDDWYELGGEKGWYDSVPPGCS